MMSSIPTERAKAVDLVSFCLSFTESSIGFNNCQLLYYESHDIIFF
jgi:hypothetical protein